MENLECIKETKGLVPPNKSTCLFLERKEEAYVCMAPSPSANPMNQANQLSVRCCADFPNSVL